MSEKRYWWLKLENTFFDEPKIKKLRRLAGGDTLTIIYLKMMLKTVNTGGILKVDRIEDDYAADVAWILDEDPDNVKLTLSYLASVGSLEMIDDSQVFLPAVPERVGTRGGSAKRMEQKRIRDAQKAIASQCDDDVTERDTSVTAETDKETDKDKDTNNQTDRKVLSVGLPEVMAIKDRVIANPGKTYTIAKKNIAGREVAEMIRQIDADGLSRVLASVSQANVKNMESYVVAAMYLDVVERKNNTNRSKTSSFFDFHQRNTDYNTIEQELIRRSMQ